MQTAIRTYSGKGASELINLIEQHKAEVDKLMHGVKGLLSYTVVRTGDGGFAVTTCNDAAGLDESARVAREWVARNAADTGVAAPKVTSGEAVVHLR